MGLVVYGPRHYGCGCDYCYGHCCGCDHRYYGYGYDYGYCAAHCCGWGHRYRATPKPAHVWICMMAGPVLRT